MKKSRSKKAQQMINTLVEANTQGPIDICKICNICAFCSINLCNLATH